MRRKQGFERSTPPGNARHAVLRVVVDLLPNVHITRAHAVGAIYAYLAAISMVVYDDVVLTKWLLANCKKKWRELEAADAKAA